jgi:uncharacterized protein (TIGR04255 family)
MTFERVQERSLERLRRPPLRLALIQARIPRTPEAEDLDRINAFTDALDGWQFQERQIARETNVVVTPAGIQSSQGEPETVSVLRYAEGGMRAAVSASSVSVECDVYHRWDDFRAAISQVFARFEEFFSPSSCDRLGVRYVNELSDSRAGGDPSRLAELLNAALIAPAVALSSLVLGSLSELRVAEGDGELVLRHGLVRPGAYLLDLDCFTVRPQPFATDTLVSQTDRFHGRIESVFAWSLHDSYLAELQGDDGTGEVSTDD